MATARPGAALPRPLGAARTAAWTAVALVAFAANSLLCRGALGDRAIDAASFTTIRLVTGAATLLAVWRWSGGGTGWRHGEWGSAAALFLYAIAFSFAYLELSAGTGALLLFGAVQATMVGWGVATGERPSLAGWTGIALAGAGLVVLVMPGLTAPSPVGAALMTVSGVAWGAYSLRGRGARDPIGVTARNFVRAAPLGLAVSVVLLPQLDVTARGALLAATSGAVTSGLGYVVWYVALRGLTATAAATAQLAVPLLAAAGGALLLAEPVSARLLVSAAAILGGFALVFLERGKG